MKNWLKSFLKFNLPKKQNVKLKHLFRKSFIVDSNVNTQDAIHITGRKRTYLALELDDNISNDNNRKSVTVVLGIISGFIVWAAITPVSNIVRASGLVTPSDSTILLSHEDGGTIKDILVKNGQTVLSGQVLLELDSSIMKTELLSISQQLNNLELQQSQLNAFINQDSNLTIANPDSNSEVRNSQNKLLQSKLVNLESRIDTLKGKIREKRVEVDSLAKQEELMRQRLKMWEGLTNQGAASRLKYLDTKSNFILIQGRHKEAQALLSQAIYDLNNLKTGEIVKARSLYASSKSEEAVLKESIKRLEIMIKRSTIRSPINGTISDIQYTSEDTVVAPGSLLMKIVPNDDKMLGIVNIPSEKIGFIQVGSDANISILPYDSGIYGKLGGTVESISGDSIFNKAKSKYYFEAAIKFTSQGLKKRSEFLPVKPGMPIRADIKTNNRTVLSYLLSPITKTLQNSFQD